jgi:hypothetical protein
LTSSVLAVVDVVLALSLEVLDADLVVGIADIVDVPAKAAVMERTSL